ncbi:MAG: hypothetical protein J7501_13435 [Bdellovibrio sp.]|nr:hypothetical protein [Bdellovibrio sp.]
MIIGNQKGLTVVELLVGVGLMAVVTGVIVSTQVNIAKEQNSIVKKLDDSIDQNLAERIIFKDFGGVDVSYNTVSIKDDSGNGFFDFYPDVPANAITGSNERIVTLSLAGGKKEFYILAQNTIPGALMVYDPVWAYNVADSSADANTATKIDFSAKLNQQHVTSKIYGHPEFWKEGIILMYDTPAKIRPVVAGAINMLTPPRTPVYLGAVAPGGGAELQALNSSVSGFINTTHPKDGTTQITSLDNFLRTVPSIGGGQSIVRVRAVNIIKYYLEPDTRKNAKEFKIAPGLLYKATYRNGKFDNPMLLADGVGKFTLRRDSLLKRMIYFKVEKAKRVDEL